MRPNQNFINSLTIRNDFQYQMSVTNPYTYIAGKFTASSDWLFGRTQFQIDLNGISGTPVATGMVIYDNVGNTIDITGSATTIWGNGLSGDDFIGYAIWEPTAGTGTLVNGTAYWVAFTITSGGPIFLKPGSSTGEIFYTNGYPADKVNTGTPTPISLIYTP